MSDIFNELMAEALARADKSARIKAKCLGEFNEALDILEDWKDFDISLKQEADDFFCINFYRKQ